MVFTSVRRGFAVRMYYENDRLGIQMTFRLHLSTLCTDFSSFLANNAES